MPPLRIPDADGERLKSIGYEPSAERPSFLMKDEEVSDLKNPLSGVEILPFKAIFERDDLARYRDLLWSLVPRDKDDVTKEVFEQEHSGRYLGYFLRVKEGVKLDEPMQACFYIKATRFVQKVHNLIVVEKGARAHIYNGCATASYQVVSQHWSVTEMFVEDGAEFSYTMIHDWGPKVRVFPRTAVRVGEDASFVSVYVNLKPSELVESAPVVRLGKSAFGGLYTVLLVNPGARFDLGGKLIFEGEGSSGEIISRIVSEGGEVVSRGDLVARARRVRGHMECSAVLLSQNARVVTVPAIDSLEPSAFLSHEAFTGQIAREQISYLMARGFSEEEARNIILRGFLTIPNIKIPENLKKEIEEVVAQSLEGF